jgi:hypothetical protein
VLLIHLPLRFQANELIATVPLAIRDRFLMCLTPLRTNSPMQVR